MERDAGPYIPKHGALYLDLRPRVIGTSKSPPYQGTSSVKGLAGGGPGPYSSPRQAMGQTPRSPRDSVNGSYAVYDVQPQRPRPEHVAHPLQSTHSSYSKSDAGSAPGSVNWRRMKEADATWRSTELARLRDLEESEIMSEVEQTDAYLTQVRQVKSQLPRQKFRREQEIGAAAHLTSLRAHLTDPLARLPAVTPRG